MLKSRGTRIALIQQRRLMKFKAILSDAQNQNDSQIKADKLADKKKAAIAEINKMQHLSDEQKTRLH